MDRAYACTRIADRSAQEHLSSAEGEDKPLKYPTIFNTADVALLTKMDIAEAVDFDRAAAIATVQSLRPGMHVLEVSAKTGKGMDEIEAMLETRIRTRKSGLSHLSSLM